MSTLMRTITSFTRLPDDQIHPGTSLVRPLRPATLQLAAIRKTSAGFLMTRSISCIVRSTPYFCTVVRKRIPVGQTAWRTDVESQIRMAGRFPHRSSLAQQRQFINTSGRRLVIHTASSLAVFTSELVSSLEAIIIEYEP
jgi:hypothetical protein